MGSQPDDFRHPDRDEHIRQVLERGTPCFADIPDLAESSRLFYRAARRNTMYTRLCDRATRLLSSFKGPEKQPTPPPPEPPYERIVDVSKLIGETTASDQSESLFFTRLPPEIRSLIYSFVLPRQTRIWLRPSPDRMTKSANRGSLWIEHFPCQTPPTDLTWVDAKEPSACCAPVRTGFFGQVKTRELHPHSDTLALMRTCQRMYLDLCELCTFCFDDAKTLVEISGLYAAVPVRHVQMVLYYRPPSKWFTFNEEHNRREAQLRESWQQKLRDVSAACQQMPGLKTLLLSVHPELVYVQLSEKESVVVMDALKTITGAPTVYAEVMGTKDSPRELVEGAWVESR